MMRRANMGLSIAAGQGEAQRPGWVRSPWTSCHRLPVCPFNELLEQQGKDLDEIGSLGLGQRREADHLPHDLETRDQREHQCGTLRVQGHPQVHQSASSDAHFSICSRPIFRGAFARRGVKHDQKAFQQGVRRLCDVDERGGDGFGKVG